ncbi:3-hydroxybutyryl-CoA dehydrogenase [Serratia plymuthica]|uniref:3-hydroxybutyryl-CoA dehydrogenase n=1 Tax=Serratia plymuthica S13 TaxID=1348660 RepID=S4YSI0_SERPL|nr:3-hydroxyacyl-CoA dehydrogenase family protein [Serratia plymuthica]AGP47195.1 3-hydroxybutyryl-CoA dehydrogenase [Serratia plymuthica S13]KYG17907.1 3-hydroxybutyryl-CoA dehydrogenase [Serratia plymuthica]QQT80666.1 3-hydroxyacyl-CoA dehydrogenase family protein [Serratia plymuthica]
MELTQVAVIGAGTMGARIAAVFAASGFRVALYSRTENSLHNAAKLIESIGAGLASSVTFTTSLAQCLQDAKIVSENIAEVLALKQQIFQEIEKHVSDECLLTTNTSSVPIGQIAGVLAVPSRFIGLHWFNPADVMPMVEIVCGPQTQESTRRQAAALCQQLGKQSVTIHKEAPGFIVNRLQYAMLREALHLVTAGIASIEDVDFAVQSTLAPRWSAMGPLKLMDFAGLDTVKNVAAILLPDLSSDDVLPPWLLAQIEQGNLGTKTGAGFYPWTAQEIAEGLAYRNDTIRAISGMQKP